MGLILSATRPNQASISFASVGYEVGVMQSTAFSAISAVQLTQHGVGKRHMKSYNIFMRFQCGTIF